jgi:hypothetical protein
MMIKKVTLFFSILVFIPFANSPAQNQITVSPVIGLYLYNSENSLPVMGDENYLLNYGFEISYRNKNLFGWIVQVDYSYLYSGIYDVLTFVKTNEGGPDPTRLYHSDVSLSLNNLDISLIGNLGNTFSFGFGPSFSIINRSITVEYYDFVDRLASFNIGVIGLIDIRIPLSTNSNYWYFYTGLKFRYLHGFYYDEGLRDLEDYNQNFVTANLALGIGYNF